MALDPDTGVNTMAGMGPPPKPADQRARRNKPPTAAVQLPPEGRQGDPPAWPLARKAAADMQLWRELWATPQAAAWDRMGGGVVRVVARYVVLTRAAAQDPRMFAEIRQLEDRLGLNPLFMRRLGWEIAPDEVAEQRAAGRRPSRYDGLRAVGGPGAVAGP
jgi:hypothetical protein